jgi:MFS family permease
VTAVAALAGFLFGYDTGVISDALLYIAPAFGLGDTGQQVAVAALLLGALVGAVVGGRFADAVGRKRTLVGAAITVGILASTASARSSRPRRRGGGCSAWPRSPRS